MCWGSFLSGWSIYFQTSALPLSNMPPSLECPKKPIHPSCPIQISLLVGKFTLILLVRMTHSFHFTFIDFFYSWLEPRWSEMKVTQLCPTLCDPMDCSLPGSSVFGILWARILKSVAISFSRGSSWSRDWTWISCTAGRFFTIWATKEALFYMTLTSSYHSL